MGKNYGPKTRNTATVSNGVSSYFRSSDKSGPTEKIAPTTPKMADGRNDQPQEGLMVSKQEFHDSLQLLEKNMSATITELLKPLTSQLNDLKQSLEQVAQTANLAMDHSLVLQDDACYFYKKDEWATDKIISLENQLKANNIKFRGIPEDAEKTTELRSIHRLQSSCAPHA